MAFLDVSQSNHALGPDHLWVFGGHLLRDLASLRETSLQIPSHGNVGPGRSGVRVPVKRALDVLLRFRKTAAKDQEKCVVVLRIYARGTGSRQLEFPLGPAPIPIV